MIPVKDQSEPSLMHSDSSFAGSGNLRHMDANQLNRCLFISDLHLCASRPHITSAFLNFLQHTATKVDALFVLGDLFEYWAGDDDVEDEFHQQIISAFRTLSQNNTKIYLMHGNRDFLISQKFCYAACITLLNDPTLIECQHEKILLSHGDDLCTDDAHYQAFRKQVRDEKWQAEFLSQPLSIRKQQVEAIRKRSEQEKSQKSAQIMDVNTDAVNALLRAFDYPKLFIHGHTHRPKQHKILLDGHTITRWVLGDWYEQGSYLQLSEAGLESKELQR